MRMRKPIIIALSVIFGLTLAIVGIHYFISYLLPPSIVNFLYISGLALLAAITMIGMLDLADRFSRKKKLEFDAQQKLRNRKNMLRLVRNTWIEGMLKKSLYDEVLIELGMETKPAAVEHPWDMVVQMPDQEPRMVTPGTTMLELFDQSSGSLLILGEPGSGKTTLMLELTRQLIEHVETDPTKPIPVVFNLSSWTPKLTFADWVVNELREKYYVSPKIGGPWIENDDLLLLIDGLDEVKIDNREACVRAINEFRVNHDIRLTICCRIQDYKKLVTHLKLQTAVVIQPLDDNKVNNYLRALGSKFIIPYRSLVQNTAQIGCTKQEQDLLHTPLFLSILVLAYQDASNEELQALTTSGDYCKKLFDDYIRKMMTRRGKDIGFPYQNLLVLLSFLARKLLEHGQIVFRVDQLQPDWLDTSRQKSLYVILSRVTTSVVICSFSSYVLCSVWLGFFLVKEYGLLVWLASSIIIGTLISIPSSIIGIICGLVGSVISLKKVAFEKINLVESVEWKFFPVWVEMRKVIHRWPNRLRFPGALNDPFGAVYILVLQLVNTLTVGYQVRVVEKDFGMKNGIEQSCLYGFISGLMGALYGVIGVISIVIARFFIRLIVDYLTGELIYTVFGYLGLVIFFGSIVGVVYFWSGFLKFGGLSGFQHYSLLLVMIMSKLIPRHFTRFLDKATELVLLRKVGNGYVFIHRMLMEHFVAMAIEKPENKIASNIEVVV